MTIKRAWDILTLEQRNQLIAEIGTFLEKEMDQKAGHIISGGLLDIVLQTVVPVAYNQGITDFRKRLEERFQDVLVDMDVLIKT